MLDHNKILIVDDEPLNLEILREFLSDDYEISAFSGGQECLDFIQTCINEGENLPFLILLDVNMPGLNGLDTCKELKSNPNSEEVEVIFVSALATPEQRILGYDAGGSDYITKPFDDVELFKKIKLTQKNSEIDCNKSESLNDAMSTAMTAMTNASEIGVILRCVQDLYGLNTNQEIADNILQACQTYGLNVIIAIAMDSDHQATASSKGVIKPIEFELISMLRSKESIFHFDKRTLFTYGTTSLLVLNMPLDNEDLYGRLKDHLAIIIEGAASRVESIIGEKQRDDQRLQLFKLVEVVQELMASLETNQMEHQDQLTILMNNMLQKIEESFIYLGLTEEQEQSFIDLIKETEKRANDLFDKGVNLQDNFTAIKMMLKKAVKIN